MNADDGDDDQGVDRAEVVPPAADRSFWSIAWDAHVYFAGTLFALMAVYCTGKQIKTSESLKRANNWRRGRVKVIK